MNPLTGATNMMQQLLQRREPLAMLLEFNPYRLGEAGLAPVDFLRQLESTGFTIRSISESDSRTPVLRSADFPSFVEGLRGHLVNLLCSR